MAKHTKKRPSKSVHARGIRRKIGTQKVNAAGRASAGRQTRLDRGQDLVKDFGASDSINKTPSPGIKARAKNLRAHGEQVPVRTRGKIDEGGPLKRITVKFQKFVNRETAKVTAKKKAAKRNRPLTAKEKADFKDKVTKIHQLRNDRFRREQEENALNKRVAARLKRKKKS